MKLSELNEQQIEAVTTIDGPLQIVAGAGSGKTRVITYRIAYLIEQGINPWNIIALTFTNKAAKEMKERLASLVPYTSANSVWAGTFHSLFAKLLRRDANVIGFDNNFTIYDSDDSLNLIKNIAKSLKIGKSIKESSILSVISNAKNCLITPSEFAKRVDNFPKKVGAEYLFEKAMADCYYQYQKLLKENNAMDFDDLLVNMYQLLQFPHILAKYQDRFQYILIDEYQDTNKVQYAIINLLARTHRNICIVGDDAQSIYKWRGADISNILSFAKDFTNTKVIKLEQNYRSTKNILSASDSLILHNKNQLKKKL